MSAGFARLESVKAIQSLIPDSTHCRQDITMYINSPGGSVSAGMAACWTSVWPFLVGAQSIYEARKTSQSLEVLTSIPLVQ